MIEKSNLVELRRSLRTIKPGLYLRHPLSERFGFDARVDFRRLTGTR
jgi:hypothetical protein